MALGKQGKDPFNLSTYSKHQFTFIPAIAIKEEQHFISKIKLFNDVTRGKEFERLHRSL